VWGLGCTVRGLGCTRKGDFGVWDLEPRVQGLRCKFRVYSFGFHIRVRVSRFRVQNSRLRFSDSRFKAQSFYST
jgi:hypothetical protein